ncbi:MAG: hypothetical protein ABSG32_25040 [Terriglobia bacterium]|jgi:hypothetical protein
MPKGAKRSIIDSGHAQRPDFSIPAPGAEHHDAAAEHYEEAARQHRQAARFYQAGHYERASHHAQLAYAHHLQAVQHAEEAAKAHMKSSRRISLHVL